MEKFLVDNWLALLSLAVALTGGVPGMLSVIEYLRRRPKFRVAAQQIILGYVRDKSGGTPRTFVALGLTLANDGERPLVPAVFNVRLREKRRTIEFDRFLIPNNLSLDAEEQEIRVDDMAARDLQRHTEPITSALPVHGWLMFLTDRISRDDLVALGVLHFEVSCIDVIGKEHTAKVDITPEGLPYPIAYPKLGATMSPRKPGA